RERFLREARALAGLTSTHVVRVFDYGHLPVSGEPYLVMELLEGEDLSNRLKRQLAMGGGASKSERERDPIKQVLAWGLDACEALAEAHANGIIHRDIKPHNLFLATVGLAPSSVQELKVVDFGLAKLGDGAGANAQGQKELALTADAPMGTPLY